MSTPNLKGLDRPQRDDRRQRHRHTGGRLVRHAGLALGASGSGHPPPYLWHWLYFLPLAQQSEIGPDGHPSVAASARAAAGRMWAGSDFAFHEPIVAGDRLSRTSTIVEVNEKSGRTGNLIS